MSATTDAAQRWILVATMGNGQADIELGRYPTEADALWAVDQMRRHGQSYVRRAPMALWAEVAGELVDGTWRELTP